MKQNAGVGLSSIPPLGRQHLTNQISDTSLTYTMHQASSVGRHQKEKLSVEKLLSMHIQERGIEHE